MVAQSTVSLSPNKDVGDPERRAGSSTPSGWLPITGPLMVGSFGPNVRIASASDWNRR